MNNNIPDFAKDYIHAQNIASVSSLVILIIVALVALGFVIAYLKVRKDKKISNKIKNCTRYGIIGSVALLIILLALPQAPMHNTRGNINVASTMEHDEKALPKEAAQYRNSVPSLKSAAKAKQPTAAQQAEKTKATKLIMNARKQETFIIMNRGSLKKPAWYSYL